MDKIDKIRMLAAQANDLGVLRGQTRIFPPPAAMEELHAYEAQLGAPLPEAFVRYMTELGNGGTGAGCIIYPLERIFRQHPEDHPGQPVMLDHSLPDAAWQDFAERYVRLDEKIDCSSAEKSTEYARQLRQMQQQVMEGGIIIGTLGCTMNCVLMYRGAARGEVFIVDFDYMDQVVREPHCCGKFEDWIINDLEAGIRNANSMHSNTNQEKSGTNMTDTIQKEETLVPEEKPVKKKPRRSKPMFLIGLAMMLCGITVLTILGWKRISREIKKQHLLRTCIVFEVPRLHIRVPVQDGTDNVTLRAGAGHFPGTGAPGSGNYCIAGHNSTIYAEIFNDLDQIEIGDVMTLTDIDKGKTQYTYIVSDYHIVPPSGVDVLADFGDDRITVITCTDDGENRQVVVGTLQKDESE